MACPLLDALFSLAATASPESAATKIIDLAFSQNAGPLNGSYGAVCGGTPTIQGPSANPDTVSGNFGVWIAGGSVTIPVLGFR